ncbi:hypothetical protein GL218_06521 [Daldinia childiae]|uniref:uncharacterized protein n=1 Tax=Daldinia childiae TaxID=326645 RepID=UPI0014465424|nr:uncharacterized protein GL218_06521 [Daldinia childiae]KAF3056475.1 hypothetical protein GL218_06521 [Daldinia childiae]
MSTSRVFTSSLRTAAKRATASTPAQRQSVLRSAARRGYSSSGHAGSVGAEKSSDMPWLIGSVVFTIPALAWLLSSSPSKKTSEHTHGGAPVPDEEKAPAVESGEDSSSSSTPASTPPSSDDGSDSDSDSDSDENPPTNQLPKKGNPKAAFGSSQTGRQVPPTSADNSDMATNYEEKKGAQEEYKEMIRKKDTRVASSSSDIPSKKGAAEHPREDPQKGEGEGVQKGGPA